MIDDTTTTRQARLDDGALGLLEQATRRGADVAEVSGTRSARLKIGFEKNDFSIATDSIETVYTLRVHRDRRQGVATTNDVSAAGLEETTTHALTLASFAVEDPHLCLPEPATPPAMPGRFDDTLAGLPVAELRRLADEVIGIARHEPRLSLDNASLEVTVRQAVIVNSHGLQVRDASTSCRWFLMGMGRDSDEVTSFDHTHGAAYSWDEARRRAGDEASTFVSKLMATFGARHGESYRGTILIAPAALPSLLLLPIQFHTSGRQLMDGKSRWEEALGHAVASPALTLVDDPFDPAIAGVMPFDSEGVPVSRLPIIENGILRAHTDDCYSARRRGTRSTGHADGLHGVQVAAGAQSLEALTRSTERLVVLERFSGNVDPIGGDFSGIAKCSHYFRDGAHAYPLRETMIAGNVFELLRSVVATSDQAVPHCNAFRAPYVLVDGVSVTAAGSP